jgi:rod shape-determining protein MreD
VNDALKQILIFLGLVFFQVLVLNNINISGLVNPYVYFLAILLLPIEISGWLLLLISFGLGITIDLFSGTPGMHSFATVTLGYLRPGIISLISQKGQDLGKLPNLKNRGLSWMLLYFILAVSVHHLVYFTIEAWSAAVFGLVVLRILASTVVSIFIMVLFLYAFKSSK